MDGEKAGNGNKVVDVEQVRKEIASQREDTYNWTFANGRRYASTELGHYFMPNDEPEIQRLNEQQWQLTQVKGGKILDAPLPRKDGLRILDLGCGTGIWCIQMAEDYPSARIVGMDVSPIQPEKKPGNVEWVLFDMEKEWPFEEDWFDLIHLSLVHGCVTDWPKMMQKIRRHLAPCGYIEHQEFSLCRQYLVDAEGNRKPIPDKLEDMPLLAHWGRLMEQASEKRGRTIQLGPKLTGFQQHAGFESVTERVCPMKVGTWPSDPVERMVGARVMLNALEGMEGFTTMLFTKALGWEVEKVRAFVEEVKKTLLDNSLRKVMDLHVVYGRKPM